LGARLGVIVIRSDAVRKRIAGKAVRKDAALNEGIYTQTMTEGTYDKMLREAESCIQTGQGVIVDATFGRRSHRETFRHLAMKHGIPFFVLHCSASDATTAKRLAQRAAEGTDISDGRWDVYVAQKAAYEALDEGPKHMLLNLPADAAVDQLVCEAAAFLRARLELPKVALQGGKANVQSSSRLRTGARRDFFSP
jgi:predicted kinase